jgi:hypothetical protein
MIRGLGEIYWIEDRGQRQRLRVQGNRRGMRVRMIEEE